jgi:AraC-like DNA-binding protein
MSGVPPLTSVRLRRALRLLIRRGTARGDEVARFMSMHRRTLNRRLKAEGTTFRAMLDEVRFELARDMLADSSISIVDVGTALGYADPSAFTRAFRRWAGTPPARWRAGARHD